MPNLRRIPAAVLAALATAGAPALADEGMWLPSQARDIAGQLRAAGLKLDPARVADLQAAPLNAIVSLGGCSAAFVSPDGLVATNHHCVYGSVQFNSRPGRDLITHGFYAPTPADELPGEPRSRIYVIKALEDVTAAMNEGLTPTMAGAARYARLDANRKALVAACEKQPNLFDVSSMSPDHAITTDPLLLDAIEIQRGPAAIRYGGNATNGAINLIDSKVPKAVPAGGLTGATEVRFGTGDEEKTVVGRVTAGIGQFAIHAEGARRRADDYEVPDAFGSDKLRDSFANSTSYAFGASWITPMGYLGAAYSRVENEYGLPGHSHANSACHGDYYSDRLDFHCRPHGDIGYNVTTPDDLTAFIRLRSDRVDVRGDYDNLLPGLAHLRLRGSYTDYRHDEIDGPTLFARFTNEVWDGRVELTHKPLFGFTGTLGVQYTDATFSGLDVNAIHLPNTDYFGFSGTLKRRTENIGVFLSERRSFGAVDVEIAARKDWRTIRTPIPGAFFTNIPPEDEIYQIEYYGPNWREAIEAEQRAFWPENITT